MSKGIVRVTPRPGAMGTLQVTVADPNPFGVRVGDMLSFPDPGFLVSEGELVDCIFTSAKTCNVIKVPVPKSVTADSE